jgi:cytochrome c peroxidase
VSSRSPGLSHSCGSSGSPGCFRSCVFLNPKQLEGLRLLVTPFAQQQFNLTADRRSERPSLGVSCFDCHQNGSTNGATHQVGDIRPQQFRHRIDTPTLRGVNVQRLFGSQRALKTVEDFTEFE